MIATNIVLNNFLYKFYKKFIYKLFLGCGLMYDELIKFINLLGFPIVICCYFIFKLESKIELLIKRIEELHQKLSEED